MSVFLTFKEGRMKGKKKSKTKAELEAEIRFLRKFRSSLSLASIFNGFFKYFTICFSLFMAYLSIKCLSGKTTDANIIIKMLGNLKVNQAVMFIMTGGSIVWAIAERKLKRRVIKKLSDRVKKYETDADKGRTSSRLSDDGSTNPEDEI